MSKPFRIRSKRIIQGLIEGDVNNCIHIYSKIFQIQFTYPKLNS